MQGYSNDPTRRQRPAGMGGGDGGGGGKNHSCPAVRILGTEGNGRQRDRNLEGRAKKRET